MSLTLADIKNSIGKIENNKVKFLYFKIIHPTWNRYHFYLPLAIKGEHLICLPIFTTSKKHKKLFKEEIHLKRLDKSILIFENGICLKDEDDKNHSATIWWKTITKIKIDDLRKHLKNDKEILQENEVTKKHIEEIIEIFKYKSKYKRRNNGIEYVEHIIQD